MTVPFDEIFRRVTNADRAAAALARSAPELPWSVVASAGNSWRTIYRGPEDRARRRFRDEAAATPARSLRLYDPDGKLVEAVKRNSTLAAAALLAGAAIALAPAPAHAESATFYMSGICSGKDAPQDYPIQLVTNQPGTFASPTIWIVGIQSRITPQDGATFSRGGYIMAGDSDETDVLAWGDQDWDGSWRINTWYPSDFAMRLGPSFHADLHFPCYPAGLTWQGFYTLYYRTVALP